MLLEYFQPMGTVTNVKIVAVSFLSLRTRVDLDRVLIFIT